MKRPIDNINVEKMNDCKDLVQYLMDDNYLNTLKKMITSKPLISF